MVIVHMPTKSAPANTCDCIKNDFGKAEGYVAGYNRVSLLMLYEFDYIFPRNILNGKTVYAKLNK